MFVEIRYLSKIEKKLTTKLQNRQLDQKCSLKIFKTFIKFCMNFL